MQILRIYLFISECPVYITSGRPFREVGFVLLIFVCVTSL